MTKEPGYITNLKKLAGADPEPHHIASLEQELYGSDSDRATVVLFASFLETHLGKLLSSIIRDDLNSNDRKILLEGNFSSKIIMAYGLKLIGPVTRSDLDLVRALRNQFAHSRIPFGFKTPEVVAVCKEFKVIDLPGPGPNKIPIGYSDRISRDDIQKVTDLTDAKTRFISTCHHISERMLIKRQGDDSGGVPVSGEILP